jgi:hypothetical protein
MVQSRTLGLRLLLDEMWSPVIAQQLRSRGYDVVAVKEVRELQRMRDADLLELAMDEQRAIVTENVDDFRSIVSARFATGLGHAGLILTGSRKYPRRHPRTVGRVVLALEQLLASDVDLSDLEVWL